MEMDNSYQIALISIMKCTVPNGDLVEADDNPFYTPQFDHP